MADPMLSIETLIERPTIKVDGQTYEIVSPHELDLLTSQRAAALGRRFDGLLKRDQLNRDQRGQLSRTLNEIADIVLSPVPAEVRSKLSDAHLMSIVEVFTMLSLARKVKLAGATVQAMGKAGLKMPPAGAKPSPGSSGSTAATPSAG